MKYRLLTNLDASFMRPYEPGDRLTDGYEGAIDQFVYDPEVVAELVWWEHNADDRPDAQTNPSLSVGDVIILGEVALSVDRTGFKIVNVDPADMLGVPYLEAIR